MVMNESRPQRSDAPVRSGFTLVEVVIALAIFVFGALAIIRIFPPALGVIQNSGDRLVGNNMNRSLLARYDRSPGLVPEAIYDPDRNRMSWQVDASDTDPIYGSVAGSRRNRSVPSRPGPLGVDLTGLKSSALGRYRNVVAEKHTLQQGEKFVYTQFPFEPGSLRAYREDSLLGVKVDQNGVLDFSDVVLGSTNQRVTVTDLNTYLTANDLLYISYSWFEDDRFWSVDEERFSYSVTPAINKVGQASRVPASVDRIVPGEVKVRLRKQLVLPAIPTTPVDETLLRPFSGMVDVGVAVGVPVTLDYTVRDWRWLVVDSAPNVAPDDPPAPGATPAPANQRMVNLPVRQMDTGEDDYLFTVYPTQDTKTVNPVTDVDHQFKTNRDAPYDERDIARSGRVPFIVNPKIPKSPTARVVYRSLDNWTQQLSVAASHYTLYFDDTSTPQTEWWRQCALSTNGRYLYFRPSEAGKTVLISYRYGTTGTPSADVPMDNQMLTIDTNIIAIPSDLPAGFTSAAQENGVARLELVDNTGAPLLLNPVTAITKIDGVGIQSRVAWLDGDRFTQVSATRIRGGETQ